MENSNSEKVLGDREGIGIDENSAKSSSVVSTKALPIIFGVGAIGGLIISGAILAAAHDKIWPSKPVAESKTGEAKMVNDKDLVDMKNAYGAMNGANANTLAGADPNAPTQMNAGEPLPNRPVSMYSSYQGGRSENLRNTSAPSPRMTAPPMQVTRQGNPISNGVSAVQSKANELLLAAQRAPIMGYAGGNRQQNGIAQSVQRMMPQAQPQQIQQAMPPSEGGFVSQGSGPQTFLTDLNRMTKGNPIETVKVTAIGNRNYLLAAGRTIPCNLQSAINSTQAGIISCVIGQDVYSENGRVVMIDKGTKVLGQYTGGIKAGQARLFVLWTRALTPRGIIIPLGSPASDEIGNAGIGGDVDSKFWDRFGSALMFSVLEDVGQYYGQKYSTAQNTAQMPSQTSAMALQGSQNIQPILKAYQGQAVAIQVAKDFDFSSVYDVRFKGGR